MERIGEHAVVIGAGIAGLLAARALSDAFGRVTVIDRDGLPEEDDHRRAVPQDRHTHGLLPRGRVCLEELLPGFGAELIARGAQEFEPLGQMRFVVAGHQLVRTPVGVTGLSASRPLIEGHVRRRVRALPAVELIERCDVAGLLSEGDRVTGVRLLRRTAGSAEEELRADLVVAANGRSSRLIAWLQGLGFPAPAEERVAVDVHYASRFLRLRPGALGEDRAVVISGRPGHPRGMGLFACEGDRWLLSLGAYGVQPPVDDEGFLAFAATIAPPDVAAALRAAEPLGPVARHRFPANVRRRYERLERFPDGLLVTGDALCAFNPTHGQGMTVAAAEAVALRACLRDGREDLARRFFAAAVAIVDHAWAMAIGGDLALPEVPGPRPARVRILNAYSRRLLAAAERDATVAAAFMRVSGMLEPPPRLLRPAIALRVLRHGLTG